MPTNFILAFLVLAALISLHLRNRGAIRFSRVFWLALVISAAPLAIGLLLGRTAFLVSLPVISSGYWLVNRSPRAPEPGEREALSKLASTDPRAAKPLRDILRQDLKGHQAMRENFLPTLTSHERAVAEASIQQLEEQTRIELEQIDDLIRQLKATHGAA